MGGGGAGTSALRSRRTRAWKEAPRVGPRAGRLGQAGAPGGRDGTRGVGGALGTFEPFWSPPQQAPGATAWEGTGGGAEGGSEGVVVIHLRAVVAWTGA